MKTRSNLLSAIGLLVFCLLAVWLLLANGAVSAGPAPVELAGIIVGGNIITDTTWSLEGSPYVLQTQNVTVADNVTLTIEPGVTVEFNAARILYVNGTLLAVGTPTQTITFTRMAGATQPWGMIQLGGGSVLTDSNATQISYATIEGGGSSPQMLYAYHSAPRLDHLTLRDSGTRGLYVAFVPASSALTWDAGTATGCGWEGVYVTSGRVTLSGLAISGNTGDGIEFASSAHDSQLSNSTVQGNGGHGILINGSDRVLLEGLTIGPNTGYGIYTQSGGANSTVRDTTVQGNAVAARLHPDVGLEDVTWSGNTRSEIEWIGGQVYSSRTWRLLPEISTYRVLGDVWFRDATTLSVEPGVTVQFDEYMGLKTMGGLWAVGTLSQPITFTLLPGTLHPWGNIEIGGGVQGDSDASQISYATIEGGGYGGKLVHLYYTSAALDHVTVRNSSSIGIQVTPFAGTQVTLDTLAVTNNAGTAIYHPQPGPSLSYRNLTLQGNGTDAVSIAGGSSILSPMQWDLADAGAPVRVGTLSIYGGGALALMPGTRLEFTSTAGLKVWFDSSFYALGTPEAPITLTGTLPQPGAWKGVWLHPSSSAILRNCAVEYGGAAGEPALKIQSPGDAVIVNSAVRYAAGDGVDVDAATPPQLSFNEISGNGFGVRNNRPAVPVDARQVWWGDVTGPSHPALNPNGLGNAVSDGVLFDPWLTGTPTGSVPLDGLVVRTAGPHSVSPGETTVYGATYFNASQEDVHDAVLVLVLPDGASFVEAYPASSGEGRGIYWSERHHVFWRLGTVPSGAGGMVAARVRFPWGLPAHTDSFMAMMGGSDSDLAAASTCGEGGAPFDVFSYLAHMPVDILSTTVLTPSEVDAERQAYQALNTLFTQALEEGFVYASAERYAITGGETVVSVLLDRPDDSATTQIVRVEQVVHAYIFDENGFTLRTVIGDMIYDRATATISFTGALGAGQRSTAFAPASDHLFFASVQPNVLQTFQAYDPPPPEPQPDYYQCYGNCLWEIDTARIEDWMARRQTGTLEYIQRELWNLYRLSRCHPDCDEDPYSHFCYGPIFYCNGRSVMAKVCDFATGRYKPQDEQIRPCSEKSKCVIRSGGYGDCAECGQGTGRDCNTVDVRVAMDPNAKVGPAGDLLPGELVSYTITYENEGEGTAYGVYIDDVLSEAFDEATLQIGPGGLYLPVGRTILWFIGELGPHGSPTASGSVTFTVRLRSGLPGGTPVINQGVVYFPSVPEETPTNQVVNVIWPVVGVPMSATVQAGHAVSITLMGRDPGGSPLTFAVVDAPRHGTLSGTPPALTYTAPAGFAGQDLFTFTASNTITESRPAEVTILVLPDPTDTTPPTVVWTVPREGAILPIDEVPVFTDTIGPMYTPYLFAGFSEAIDASTVTTATLRITGPDGTAIPVTVSYDGVTGEAAAQLRQPLEAGTWYTVRATQGIKDLIGNPLAADFVWMFHTAGGGNLNVYLPLVLR